MNKRLNGTAFTAITLRLRCSYLEMRYAITGILPDIRRAAPFALARNRFGYPTGFAYA